ncbi:hypothetical protein V565_359630, partial [Rhizoctonia solani 123E]
ASKLAAVAAGQTTFAADATRRRLQEFRRTKTLPTHLYGKANDSVIADEELADAVKVHLRAIGKYMKAQDILGFFGTPEAQKFTHLINKPPTLRTAQNWMHKLGYRWGKERRGMFADGHVRKDVVDY